MIETREGFRLSCTTCPKTGGPCAPGLALARQLARAVTAAGGSVANDFEMTGHGALEGCCAGECGVVYSLCKRGFGVFCGVPNSADPTDLMAVARGFLGTGPVRSSPMPRAMIFAERPAPTEPAVYAT
jgi:hypothetical protein